MSQRQEALSSRVLSGGENHRLHLSTSLALARVIAGSILCGCIGGACIEMTFTAETRRTHSRKEMVTTHHGGMESTEVHGD